MANRNNFTLLCSCLFLLLGCNNDDDISETALPSGNCDKGVLISQDKYDNTVSDIFTLTAVQITGDCLEIGIQAGGCSGETWKIDLLDSGAIGESYPEQRFLKVSLENEEVCLALPTRVLSFNLKPLRSPTNDQILLNLEGWEKELLYTY